MYNLLFINLQIPLGVVSWLDLTAVIGIAGLFVYVYRIGRTKVTRKDMVEALKTKVEEKVYKKDLEIRDIKLDSFKELLKEQNQHIKDVLEENKTTLEDFKKTVDELVKRVYSKAS